MSDQHLECPWLGFTPHLTLSPFATPPEGLREFLRSGWSFDGSPYPTAGDGAQPVAAVTPSVLNVQQGQRAEFRCTVTGTPTPAIEWTGRTSHEDFWILLGRELTVNVVCPRWAGQQDESQSPDPRRRAHLHGSGPR